MASEKAKIKRDPERWLANWLEDLGQTYDYEPPMGGRNPDFVLPKGGPPKAAIELEEFHFSPDEWREYLQFVNECEKNGSASTTVRGKSAFAPVRKKIECARKQLKGCKGLPCMLALYDATQQRRLHDSWVIFGAMLGVPSIGFAVKRGCKDDPAPSFAEPRNVWGEGGKMIDAKRRVPQNTTISAIGVLSWKPVLWHRFDKDPDYTEPCVDIYLNPFAAIRWPAELVGTNDTVWEWDPESGEIRKLHDGIARMVKDAIPRKSQEQIDIEAIQNDPALRNGS